MLPELCVYKISTAIAQRTDIFEPYRCEENTSVVKKSVLIIEPCIIHHLNLGALSNHCFYAHKICMLGIQEEHSGDGSSELTLSGASAGISQMVEDY